MVGTGRSSLRSLDAECEVDFDGGVQAALEISLSR